MDLHLAGKVVLVVGATQGMGRGIALGFGSEGAHVIVSSRGHTEGDEQYNVVAKPQLSVVVKEVESAGAASAMAARGDFTQAGDAERVIGEISDAYGRLDVIVNTVGLCEVGATPIEDDGWWDRSYQSVLMSSVRACRAGIPLLLESGGGSVILTSAMSMRHFIPALAHYSAQKAALSHFTKNLAKQYGPQNIRVNAILPGMIQNEQHIEMTQARMRENGLTAEEDFARQNAHWGNLSWSSRFGLPKDIADAALYLASERASYVNGILLNVDGGSEYL